MGRANRRWQNDENLLDNAHELLHDVSDEDAAAALLWSLLTEPGGDD
jgi:hypothetical protein